MYSEAPKEAGTHGSARAKPAAAAKDMTMDELEADIQRRLKLIKDSLAKLDTPARSAARSAPSPEPAPAAAGDGTAQPRAAP